MPNIEPSGNVLDTFIRGEEQTLQQLTDSFEHLITDSSALDLSSTNIDGVLNYLETRENEIANAEHLDDQGSFTIIDQSIPTGTNDHSSISFGNTQCLDVMLNHLQARETSLERSPEYSIELNVSELITSHISEPSQRIPQPVIDNRFVTDSSDNNSTDPPDNDIAVIDNCSTNDSVQNSSINSDGLEFIDLETATTSNEQSSIIMSNKEDNIHLKVDNFVSSEVYYDSDKDIDESETLDGSNDEDIGTPNSYIPSFHQETVQTFESYVERPQTTPLLIWNNNDHVSINNNQSNEPLLPGEAVDSNIIMNDIPTIHLRSSGRSNVSYVDNESNESEVFHDNNDVQSFELDPSFDYNNAHITPRLNHYSDR